MTRAGLFCQARRTLTPAWAPTVVLVCCREDQHAGNHWDEARRLAWGDETMHWDGTGPIPDRENGSEREHRGAMCWCGRDHRFTSDPNREIRHKGGTDADR